MKAFDLSGLKLNTDRPKEERKKRFLETGGNPYLFTVNGVTVKVTYSNTTHTLQEKVTRLLRREMAK